MDYVDVILPLYLDKAYTYIVPEELKGTLLIGQRVLVQFGRNKYYAGIVAKCHNTPPEYNTIKEVEELIDIQPIIHTHNLEWWYWISQYYMCGIGEVMDNALPGVLKLSSERQYIINEFIDITQYDLNEIEYTLAEAIQNFKQISVLELKKIVQKPKITKELNTLIQEGIIFPLEHLTDKYSPKVEKYIKIATEYISNQENINILFAQLEKKSPAQWKLLLTYFSMSPQGQEVVKSDLIIKSNGTSAQVKSLIDKKILIEYTKIKERFELHTINNTVEVSLSPKQEETYEKIKKHFELYNTTLLRGITGSGKTEIYIKWLQDSLSQNKSCLLILPEIALTTQIVQRLHQYFGNNLAVYHSQINQNKKYELWQKIYKGEVKLIIGTRSAIFLPFQSLDAIVIDEEHDMSLKQSDTNPRYHARDVLHYFQLSMKSKILLCSATPSSETYFNVLQSKIGYVEILERFHEAQLPKIEFINLKDKEKDKKLKSHYSDTLIEAIQSTFDQKLQTVLFHNRRGYSPYVQCNTCDFIEKCDNCDVRLTYHATTNQLICHYCYKKYVLKLKCTNCGNNTLKTRGLGTQKVEEEMQLFFPHAIIKRMDIDTVRSNQRLEMILNDFNQKKIDILIGTQMVAKGLDFEHLTTVGVINADTLFSFTDYKTNEKAFQTLYQVSGRVGRRDTVGTVYIQTYDPNFSVLKYLEQQDWLGFMTKELELRKEFVYPPYCKILKITLKHLKEDLVQIFSQKVANRIRKEIHSHVLGPAKPSISRIQNKYIQEIIIKLPRNNTLMANKLQIKAILDHELFLLSNKNFTIDLLVDF